MDLESFILQFDTNEACPKCLKVFTRLRLYMLATVLNMLPISHLIYYKKLVHLLMIILYPDALSKMFLFVVKDVVTLLNLLNTFNFADSFFYDDYNF